MTIGDLFDLLEDKLKTGELNRMDELMAEGNNSDSSDWVNVLDVRSAGYGYAIISINVEFEWNP
jgi:hypothetical protein